MNNDKKLSLVLMLILLVGLSFFSISSNLQQETEKRNDEDWELQLEIYELQREVFQQNQQQDREIIFSLVQKLYFPNKDRDNRTKNREIAERLEKYSNQELVVETIIDQLNTLHKEGHLEKYVVESNYYGAPVFYSIDVLNKTTPSKSFAHNIGAMLDWDEMYIEKDKTTRNNLVNIIVQIGTKEEIKYLNIFAKKVKGVNYEKNSSFEIIQSSGRQPLTAKELAELDQKTASWAIAAIKNYSSD